MEGSRGLIGGWGAELGVLLWVSATKQGWQLHHDQLLTALSTPSRCKPQHSPLFPTPTEPKSCESRDLGNPLS